MHERNIYRNPPDFKKLSEKYEDFARFVRISADGRGHLNFKDPEALRELTYTLLKEDFNIFLSIPLDRLIPTLSVRLNYIHWIEDLLSIETSSEEKCADGGDADAATVLGIDIGCGASCIYPLLGARMNNWKFIATELDELSFQYAKNNISKNNMTDRISIKKGKKETILRDIIEENSLYDFCMCNPPFFGDREEASGDNSRTGRRLLPSSCSTATENESITEGGEVAFVKKMIDESMLLKDKILWYTSMLGKKKSLKSLKKYLYELKIPCISSTSFEQGKTARWGICWSFHDVVKNKLSCLSKPKSKINTAPFSFSIGKDELQTFSQKSLPNTNKETVSLKLVFNEIEKLLQDLEITFTETSVFDSRGNFEYSLDGEALKNTWTHQRQRRRNAKRMKMRIAKETNKNTEKGEQIAYEIQKDINCQSDVLPNSSCEGNNETVVEICSNERKEILLTTSENVSDVSVDIDSKKGSEEIYLKETTHEHSEDNQKTIIGSSGNTVKVDTPKDNSTNERKRTFDQFDSDQDILSKQSFLFKFKLVVRSNNDKSINGVVLVDISCVEGSREGVHQIFMYLRNKLNGKQIRHS